MPEYMFVKDIAEKDYYSGCKTLYQDIELEIFIHLFTHKRKKYLAVARSKHRIPTVIEEDDKYFILKFSGLNIPRIEDLDKKNRNMKKLPKDFELDENSILDKIIQ